MELCFLRYSKKEMWLSESSRLSNGTVMSLCCRHKLDGIFECTPLILFVCIIETVLIKKNNSNCKLMLTMMTYFPSLSHQLLNLSDMGLVMTPVLMKGPQH
ncbi:hypothetical protein NL108_003543 [Boleophthalmus pectinirostris]|nr:hypothetical protein NL108_003543 [Boleophthalmus pectinirostris]